MTLKAIVFRLCYGKGIKQRKDGDGSLFYVSDVSGISEQEIVRSVDSLKENGFINYFGMQRFGTGAIMTHEIGYQILKKEFQEACELILKPRPGGKGDGGMNIKKKEKGG